MSSVLVIGATGGIGKHVLSQLLERNVSVKALIRNPQKLPENIKTNPNLTIIQVKSIAEVTEDELVKHLEGCSSVVSCLGHDLNFHGIFRSGLFVLGAAKLVCNAITKLKPATPIKVAVVNTVGVVQPGDIPRSFANNAIMGFLRVAVGPFKDSWRSADYFNQDVGRNNPYIEWCLVRPDGLIDEGKVSKYVLKETMQWTIFKAFITSRENVGHFFCELVTNNQTWSEWKGKMPIIINEKQ